MWKNIAMHGRTRCYVIDGSDSYHILLEKCLQHHKFLKAGLCLCLFEKNSAILQSTKVCKKTKRRRFIRAKFRMHNDLAAKLFSRKVCHRTNTAAQCNVILREAVCSLYLMPHVNVPNAVNTFGANWLLCYVLNVANVAVTK